ncbi:MAG: DUF2666 family protein [Candidatus Methanofastidiosa archaeon]|nr:DUF2666 family protein [Candidatus Methanofastidiosa archaeon]
MIIMEDHISFSTKYKSWIVVKKMKVDENIEDIDVGRILLSIRDTIDGKIYELLQGDFDIEGLKKIVDEIVPSGKLNEEQMASALKTAKSPKATKMLKELTEEKLKLEVYKGLLVEMVVQKLNLSMLALKSLDKYLDDKSRRL